MAPRTLPHLSHWGAFSVTVDDDRIVSVEGHRDDPAPSALLGNFVDGKSPGEVVFGERLAQTAYRDAERARAERGGR
jgi:biotin/methionine sulfoxide reductase